MQLSAAQIADFVNGQVEGDASVEVNRPSKIEEGGAGSISFLANPKYEEFVYTTSASVLLVSRDFQPKQKIAATLIRVDHVYEAVSRLLHEFGRQNTVETGKISSLASIHQLASIGKGVSIGDFTLVSAGTTIGSGAIIYPQVFLGEDVQIGKNVCIYPGARILARCVIGDNCIIHANVVIGGDGFGFLPQADGSYEKIVHVGNVLIEENCEIGSGTTIDRATIGSTIIRSGVKLDNLIQIGHNCEIGENTVIAAQTGVAGSTRIGKNCRIGGQVGFVGHAKIADGTQIQAQSGIAGSVETPNTALFGSPAIDYRTYVRSYAVFKKLPELYRQIGKLEKLLRNEGNESGASR